MLHPAAKLELVDAVPLAHKWVLTEQVAEHLQHRDTPLPRGAVGCRVVFGVDVEVHRHRAPVVGEGARPTLVVCRGEGDQIRRNRIGMLVAVAAAVVGQVGGLGQHPVGDGEHIAGRNQREGQRRLVGVFVFRGPPSVGVKRLAQRRHDDRPRRARRELYRAEPARDGHALIVHAQLEHFVLRVGAVELGAHGSDALPHERYRAPVQLQPRDQEVLAQAEAERAQRRLQHLDAHEARADQCLGAGHDLEGQVVVQDIGQLRVLNKRWERGKRDFEVLDSGSTGAPTQCAPFTACPREKYAPAKQTGY